MFSKRAGKNQDRILEKVGFFSISKCKILLSLFFVLGVCLFMTVRVNAASTTYYVDATGGLDTNNGTSVSTPWKTITKVNTSMDSATIKAGDFVYFKRGETFTGYLDVDVTGTAGNI